VYRPDGTLHSPSHADIIKPQSGESDLQVRLDGVLTQLANAQTCIATLKNQVQHIGAELNGERASRAIERKTTDDERESLKTRVQQLEARTLKIDAQLNGERASRAIERKTTDDERESLKTRIQQLEARMSKVSVEEWDRIKAVDEKVQQERARDLTGQRLVSSCSCRGEVESCFRCSGSGSYMTDGYGNLV